MRLQVIGGKFLQSLPQRSGTRHLLQSQQLLERLVASEIFDGVIVADAQAQQAQVALDHIAGPHTQCGGKATVDAVDAGGLDALADDRQSSVAGESAATGAKLDVGHGSVWVNGDNAYIAMQVSGLEVFRVPASRIQVVVSEMCLGCRYMGLSQHSLQ